MFLLGTDTELRNLNCQDSRNLEDKPLVTQCQDQDSTNLQCIGCKQTDEYSLGSNRQDKEPRRKIRKDRSNQQDTQQKAQKSRWDNNSPQCKKLKRQRDPCCYRRNHQCMGGRMQSMDWHS